MIKWTFSTGVINDIYSPLAAIAKVFLTDLSSFSTSLQGGLSTTNMSTLNLLAAISTIRTRFLDW